MRASLQQLDSFYWVARLGGFHAAARHQNLTQPTISSRIQELEEILGAKLFERGGYRATITPFGRSILAQAEQMLQLADQIEHAARRAYPLRGLLRLGTNEATMMSGLIELLSVFKVNFPDRKVHLTIDVGATLARKLVQRELDMTLLMEPVAAPHIVDQAIGRCELLWVAAAGQALPKREMTPADVAALAIVVTPPPSALYSTMAAWFRAADCAFDPPSTCNSVGMMTQMVAAGYAVALLPKTIAQPGIDGGLLRAMAVKPKIAPRTYYIAYPDDEPGLADGTIARLAQEVLTRSGLLLPL